MILLFLCPRESPCVPGKKVLKAGEVIAQKRPVEQGPTNDFSFSSSLQIPVHPRQKAFFSRGHTGIYGDKKQKAGGQKNQPSYGGMPRRHPFIPGQDIGRPRFCGDPAF